MHPHRVPGSSLKSRDLGLHHETCSMEVEVEQEKVEKPPGGGRGLS